MRNVLTAAVAAVAIGLTGCASCDDHDRDLDLSKDLVPGDLAHLRTHSPDSSGGTVQECTRGFPLVFLPVFGSWSEVTADRVDGGEPHFHAEDDALLGLVLAHRFAEAKFDDEGHLLRHKLSRGLLLGLLSNSEKSSWVEDDGSRSRRSETSLLGGLLWKRVEENGRSDTRFLLIPLRSELDE